MESINRKKWRAFRDQILERDDFMCFYCGTLVKVYCEQTDVGNRMAHIDHLLPQCKGGGDDLSNLVTSCRSCNCSKGKKSLEDYRSFVGFNTNEYIRAQVYLRYILEECEQLPFRKQLKAMLEWLEKYHKPVVFPGEMHRSPQRQTK